MSYQYHGTTDLIALPNRTVQTYPSGLVRVERSFVCRKNQVAKYRNTIKVNEPMPFDDGAPAIDGLYIFPEPQELVRDDGFVEFRVTAYGRTSATGILERSSALEFFQAGGYDWSSLGRENTTFSQIFRGVFPSYLLRIVAPSEQFIEAIPTPAFVFPDSVEMVVSDASGNAIAEQESATVFVPYVIWENYILSGPPGPLLYQNNYLIVRNRGTDGNNYVRFNSFPYAYKNRFSGIGFRSILSSTNFGNFVEYLIDFRTSFSVRFDRAL